MWNLTDVESCGAHFWQLLHEKNVLEIYGDK